MCVEDNFIWFSLSVRCHPLPLATVSYASQRAQPCMQILRRIAVLGNLVYKVQGSSFVSLAFLLVRK